MYKRQVQEWFSLLPVRHTIQNTEHFIHPIKRRYSVSSYIYKQIEKRRRKKKQATSVSVIQILHEYDCKRTVLAVPLQQKIRQRQCWYRYATNTTAHVRPAAVRLSKRIRQRQCWYKCLMDTKVQERSPLTPLT